MNQQNKGNLAPTPVVIENIEPKSGIGDLFASGLSFIIYIVVAISFLSLITSFITGLVLSLIKSKYAKYAWISLGVTVLVLIICIIAFTIISVTRNLS